MATIKHRGVKIVPVKVTRYEVRTVDNRKLKTFGSTGAAKAWIDGYTQAQTELLPRLEAAKAASEPKRRRRQAQNGADVVGNEIAG